MASKNGSIFFRYATSLRALLLFLNISYGVEDVLETANLELSFLFLG